MSRVKASGVLKIIPSGPVVTRGAREGGRGVFGVRARRGTERTPGAAAAPARRQHRWKTASALPPAPSAGFQNPSAFKNK